MAAFERTLIAMNSPFDRFRAGEFDALTDQQRRGMETFDDVGCDRCHEGPMFSDFDLHAEGVRENPKLAEPDAGTRRFRFRTPSLRNVALTAPYFHNGMLPTLEDVLRHYDNGRSENPNVVRRDDDDDDDDNRGLAQLSGRFRRVDDMSDREMRDIIAFLQSLTDTNFDRTIPARVPSGLPPGGRYPGPASDWAVEAPQARQLARSRRPPPPRIDRSSSSIGCMTGLVKPMRAQAAAICSVQPGLAVAMMSGCSALMCSALRSPSAAAGCGCTRL